MGSKAFTLDASRITHHASRIVTYDDIRAAVEAEGFILRGGFHPDDKDAVPDVASGIACKTIVLIGNAGPAMWRRFSASPEFGLDEDPLNAFSRRVIGALAKDLDAHPLYPFTGPPYLPFLKWAQRAEPVWPSPIGPLIHPEYGLWHAYRGALCFDKIIDLPPRPEAKRPCDTCAERPCLHTCPVNAFDGRSYDVPACIAHIRRPQGNPCFGAGCLARRACPVGVDYAYAPAQAEFHTRAFLNANLARMGGNADGSG